MDRGTPAVTNGTSHCQNATASHRRDHVDTVRACETSEMKQWAQELRVNKPIPKDILPLLAKDDAKQMEIVLKNMSLDRSR
jgi:hypothetical protein